LKEGVDEIFKQLKDSDQELKEFLQNQQIYKDKVDNIDQ